MIRVLIADDHAVVRAGVKQILADTPDITVAAEASSGQEALEMARKGGCDVLLLDLSMPGQGGLEILKQLKAEMPRLPVLVLTMHPEDQYAVRTIRAGAAGYLTKQSVAEELITALRTVFAGKKYITPAVADKLADEVKHDSDQPIHASLSDREFQIFIMIARGKTVSQIGDELCLSVKTISTYRARILEKMEMKSNSELTHYAFQQNLVT
jgi:two-component system invasion response regulator UvrY